MQSNLAAVVTLESVSLSYGDHVVFSDLSLRLNKGETLGLLGLIGAGKTRILRLIAQLERPQVGQIQFQGSAANQVGIIFQNDLLLPWLTVEENLAICRREAAAPEVDVFDVRPLYAKHPHELSGGMRQTVSFARALANRDPILLMDEPFSALDPFEKEELIRKFTAYRSKHQVSSVFVTHHADDAILMCDRIALVSSTRKNIAETLVVAEHDQAELKSRIESFYRTEGRER